MSVLSNFVWRQYDNLTVITDYGDGPYPPGPTLNNLVDDYY